MKKIEPCPFCKSQDTYIDQLGNWFVCCNDCEAHGPVEDTKYEAIESWNLRGSSSEDVNIISHYMKKVRGFYQVRKKNFRI